MNKIFNLAKREKILFQLKKLHADVALLQGTHLAAKEVVNFQCSWVSQAAINKKAIVVNLLYKHLQCRVLEVDRWDGQGILILLNFPSKLVRIYNIYGPLEASVAFLSRL